MRTGRPCLVQRIFSFGPVFFVPEGRPKPSVRPLHGPTDDLYRRLGHFPCPTGNRPGHYSNRNTTDPHIWQVKVREVLKPTDFSNRYIAEVQLWEGQKVSGKILLRTDRDPSTGPFKVDDEIVLYEALRPIRPPLNPHQFDYRNYMWNLGVRHQVAVGPDAFWLKPRPSRTLYGLASSARNAIVEKLAAHHFGEEERSVIQALLLGERSDIPEATYEHYKNAGAVHILALSGLHIGILLMACSFYCGPWNFCPRARRSNWP